MDLVMKYILNVYVVVYNACYHYQRNMSMLIIVYNTITLVTFKTNYSSYIE